MKTIKNHIFPALTIILLTTALLVTACINADQEGTPKTKEEVAERGKKADIPPGQGVVQIKFDGDFRSALIMPGESLEDLIFYVEVTHLDGLVMKTLPRISLSEVQDDITLYVGEYYIYVFGCKAGRSKDEAALAGKEKVTVTAGGITPAFIELKGNTESTVNGTFICNITSPDAGPFISPSITITPYFSGKGSPAQTIPMTTFTTTGAYSNAGIPLLPGYYNVLITWGKTDYETKNERYMLHIYPTLTSHLDCNLAPLTKTNITVTFKANGGLFDSNGLEEKTVNYTTGSIINRYVEEIPTHLSSGTTFLAWYKDEDLNHPWNFDDIVWLDTTLWAKWDEEEVLTEVDFDIDAEGDGGEIFVFGKSLEKIMTANPGSYLLIEIQFMKNIYTDNSGDYWFLNGDTEFGRIFEPNRYYDHHLKMSDVNSMLPYKNYTEGELAYIRIEIDTIHEYYKGLYTGEDPHWTEMDSLTILIQHTGHAQLTGRLLFREGPDPGP